ncbi:cell division topological specificity factor MinE [Buchnera aphidicola]|uniref:cell division topological specificity factor MinE n=1 Tax=Buchnera aphidicola TaxID=9 RepID=UPI0020936060|nr:cell division topological specificity factor MinE [Buchnera aphidicola]USS94345.1 cell division topological specificity factor MinE [Buchnera aphidicola (Sipha maydis)]WII23504.1 cell division topological specificity factor MinE [Buchnera aphidicola (Sipha maydis)]
MTLLDFFLSREKKTAFVAKKRLQIIIAEQNKDIIQPNYIPKLKKDILKVICKYINIDQNSIKVQLEKNKKNISILELNVILPN